jgi:hypothetical protein
VSAVLVYGSGLALLVGNLATREDRVTEYRVRGTLQGVDLDLGNGSVEVLRGGPRAVLTVRDTGRSAYGHRASSGRSIADGVLRVRSRCPQTVLRSCSVAYRLVVPDNVPVDVRTDTGAVRFRDYRGSARVRTRSGDVDVTGFCGFSLQARAESGSLAAQTSCPPPQLSLRSTSGDVHAVVPTGRYQVEAESASGGRDVEGVVATSDAPFSLQALSSSGDVEVRGRR